MSAYDSLRHFADSWGLVMMGVAFLAFTGWAFRPHGRAANDRAANSIFEDEDHIDG
ncbi:cbb3-type cytochrome c oxidase subunit 3 [Sphingomonas sp. dw_22]|uniref:cbb3-type cytochrome oxidase subunit 3 n=1 Tax=Sphingomonas sp. dw_22 TaxID=2721175 RepID=UPI001BD2E1CD|nr:cbb3-type cytochrome c oxidase subunit 3 [Sphingomonas sp. dw_22]